VRREIRTDIDIEAPPEDVWPHLVGFADYADWNPFITPATGAAEEAQKLSLRMNQPGGRPLTIRPTVTAVSTAAGLEWLRHHGVPGLIDGRHRFALAATGSGTRLVQSESFRGLLVRPLRRSLDGTP
jgi:hypothetical protein